MPFNRLVPLALLLTQLACATLLPPRPAVTWDSAPTALILRASNCCGLVPQTFVDNYIPDAQLFGDGRLVWVQSDSSGQRRVLTATLTTAEMEALLKSFVDAGFFGWNDTYADYSVTDMPSTCLQVTLMTTSRQVCEYYRGAPKAFHRLFNDLAAGAGHAGTDFIPQRGYLTAYEQTLSPAQQQSPDLGQWQWPAESVGFSLQEAMNGRWIDGPALELAWTIISANQWNTLVQDGVNYYQITVMVPEVSWAQPPADRLPIESTPHPWAAAPDLIGSEWILVELNGAAPIAGSHLTLAFEADQLGGYAGCNWYGSTYQDAAPNGATPEVGFAATKRACSEPAGVMQQEQVFLTALQSAAGRRLVNDRLEYHDAAGATLAAFVAQPQLDLDPAALVGTRWDLVSLAGAAPLAGTQPTLVFESDSALTGNSGCRDFRATYLAKGDDLSLTFMEMLTLDCADEPRLTQEGAYTTLLSEATDYRLGEGQLEIITAGGQSLLFAAAK